jgi:hypothetical protein
MSATVPIEIEPPMTAVTVMQTHVEALEHTIWRIKNSTVLPTMKPRGVSDPVAIRARRTGAPMTNFPKKAKPLRNDRWMLERAGERSTHSL